MPHSKQAYPYVVIGNGVMSDEDLKNIMKFTGKVIQPITEIAYASNLEIAQENADRMAKLHDTVIIASIEKVVK